MSSNVKKSRKYALYLSFCLFLLLFFQIEIQCAGSPEDTAWLSMKYTVQNRNLKEHDNRLKNEFRVGEIVDFEITVENQNMNSSVDNLIIAISRFPNGLQLQGGTGAIVLEGAEGTVTSEGNGWKLTIEELLHGMSFTIKYACIVSEAVNGMEIITTATASGDNAPEVNGSTKIWVNSPEIQIVNTADKISCREGETITWRACITQVHIGCIARNVAVEVAGVDGTEFIEESVRVLDSRNRKITNHVEITGKDFIIRTGSNLVKEDYYNVLNAAAGETVQQYMWNPFNEMEALQLIIEYQIVVKDADRAGRKVVNHITANSDEGITADSEAALTVYTPFLKREKKSGEQVLEAGDNAKAALFFIIMSGGALTSVILQISSFRTKIWKL